jgi:hypothetical protein
MKKCFLASLVVTMCVVSLPAFSQKDKSEKDTANMLGMAGDNLDLYAVLNLFQKSKTIEAFEKALNEEKTGINNLDLNLDKKVDFIKVVTKQVDSSYTFTLQVDVTKKETQDVAVILLDKIKGRISLQIVGDEDLYGKDYVIEPKGNSPVTANPAYKGPDPVVVNVPATTTVVVQSAPIVQYVYSPAYVPYYPPYYYGVYPPYFAAFTIMAVGIYRHNHYHYHGGYHGGHYGGGNTVIINNGNRNQINHNSVRNSSRTVSDNSSRGNYGDNRGRDGARNSASTRPSTSDRSRGGGMGNSASTRPSTSDRSRGGGLGNSGSSRPSASQNFSSSRGPSGGGRSMGGGGRSMGGGGRRR